MDYMEGGPVMTRDALERGRCIPEPLALQYFRDMCKVCRNFLSPVSTLYVSHPQLLKKPKHQLIQAKHCHFPAIRTNRVAAVAPSSGCRFQQFCMQQQQACTVSRLLIGGFKQCMAECRCKPHSTQSNARHQVVYGRTPWQSHISHIQLSCTACLSRSVML